MGLDAIRSTMLAAFRRRRRVLVAFSGGVDSGLVAKLAHDALDGGALAVIADAESLSRRELRDAEDMAAEIGIPLRIVPVSDLTNPRYRANPTNRCYFCRADLAAVLTDVAAKEGFGTIADGIHRSDLGDTRPGILAMNEAGFWHPLIEFDLGKAEVRAMAEALGLSFHDKPNNACLSSRVPQGTPITAEVLRRVEAAEDVLRDRGFRQVRVRHHGRTARIEVPPEDLPGLRAVEGEVASALRRLGYEDTVIDPRGYRSAV